MSSSVKKNTKRKHENDHTMEDTPVYRNIHEVELTLQISKGMIKQIYTSIETWLAEHRIGVEGMKTARENNKLIPLLHHLNAKFEDLFDEENDSQEFIRTTLRKIIQRYLYNLRRRRGRGQSQMQSPFSPTGDNPQSLGLPIATIVKSRIVIENLLLLTRFSSELTPKSICTVGDVLDEETAHNANLEVVEMVSLKQWHAHNANLDVVERVSLKQWQKILKEDLNYVDDYLICWKNNNEPLQIRSNSDLKYALLLCQSRGQDHIDFWLTRPVSGDQGNKRRKANDIKPASNPASGNASESSIETMKKSDHGEVAQDVKTKRKRKAKSIVEVAHNKTPAHNDREMVKNIRERTSVFEMTDKATEMNNGETIAQDFNKSNTRTTRIIMWLNSICED